MMTDLSLRARLLAGLAVVAAVLAAVAWTITAITRTHLIDQVDQQLVAASDPVRNRDFGEPIAGLDPPPPVPDQTIRPDLPERLGSLFEGILDPEQGLEIFFEPNLPGQDFSAPNLDWNAVADTAGISFTADAVDGDVRYRVLAVPIGDAFFVRALPLADVDETVNRLILFEIIGLLAVLVVLAAVAWWVIHLGIRPINAMTRAAADITHSDLSIRVPEPAATGTEAGALARTLNTMLDRIESAVDDRRRSEERLRRFVADASHELRTPVTTIQGYAELYGHGGLGDRGALDDAMRRTGQEARRMARLVDDMLTLAKLDQDRPADRTEVSLTDLVADFVVDARVTAPDHVIIDNVESGLTVVGDEDRLRQVLANIIGNATTHTPAGSTVSIDAGRDGDGILIEIHDDGPGIDVRHLGRVTERFYRADPSRSRQSGGSGLGLSIAEAAVAAHGGSLHIDSEPDQGTTVTLRLPVR